MSYQSTLSINHITFGFSNITEYFGFIYLPHTGRATVTSATRFNCYLTIADFTELGIMTVYLQYIYESLRLINENLESFQTRNHVLSHNTRGQQYLSLLFCRLSKPRDSFIHLEMKMFNKLPATINHLSPEEFSNTIEIWPKKQFVYSINECYEDVATLSPSQ